MCLETAHLTLCLSLGTIPPTPRTVHLRAGEVIDRIVLEGPYWQTCLQIEVAYILYIYSCLIDWRYMHHPACRLAQRVDMCLQVVFASEESAVTSYSLHLLETLKRGTENEVRSLLRAKKELKR